MVMTNGIGANLTNEEKRAHLSDIGRARLIDQICIQEILPPESASGARVASVLLTEAFQLTRA